MLENFGLDQIEDEPTRCGNILDHFLTFNHTLVHTIQFVPGIADHDIMVADVNVKPQITKQKPQCCLLWILFVIRVCFLLCCLVCSFQIQSCDHLLGKGRPLALLLVVFSCVLSLSHTVSRVRCGTWLYRFMIYVRLAPVLKTYFIILFIYL